MFLVSSGEGFPGTPSPSPLQTHWPELVPGPPLLPSAKSSLTTGVTWVGFYQSWVFSWGNKGLGPATQACALTRN